MSPRINAPLIDFDRGVSPFSGESSLLEGTPPQIMARVYSSWVNMIGGKRYQQLAPAAGRSPGSPPLVPTRRGAPGRCRSGGRTASPGAQAPERRPSKPNKFEQKNN